MSHGGIARQTVTSGSGDWKDPLAAVWSVLLGAAALAREPARLPAYGCAFALADDAVLRPVQGDVECGQASLLHWQPGDGWSVVGSVDPDLRGYLELYLPLCQPLSADVHIVGHLGQSIDGCIATHSGDSCFVNGLENLAHLHRLRALSDAVIVGAGTVAGDDPRLTTRLVPGPNPVRVVLDPRGRLGAGHRLFNDGAAPTLVVRSGDAPSRRLGRCEVIAVPGRLGRFHLHGVVDALVRRGLRRLFIEGGGVTVSAFLEQGLLDRLQVTVAPVIIGQGRIGLHRRRADVMAQALRPPVRAYLMGQDVCYDFALGGATAPAGDRGAVRRIF
ncbi:MAG: RibD family protein [Thiohalocapsa sp.]|jgi:riboflavin-specific deaminase-like protein